MVQKSQTTTWDGVKTLQNNGINKLPTSNPAWLAWISEPSTLAGGFKYFLYSPLLVEDSHFD